MYSERVAVVTGGSKGIGREVAGAFVEKGLKVAIAARNLDDLSRTAKEISLNGSQVLPVQVDLRDPEGVKALFARVSDELGSADILVNSAVTSSFGPFLSLTEEDWRSHIESKLFGYILCARSAVPSMIEKRWGRIVNMGGMSTRVVGRGRMSNGVVTAAITNFGKQLAQELAEYNILVNTIHPGHTATPRLEALAAANAAAQGITASAAMRQFVDSVPIGRLIDPRDVATLAAFLCSDENVAVTGQAIAVDGGSGSSIPY